MIFVIPAFKDLFKSFGADLPGPTIFVMNVSDFFVEYWYIIFGISRITGMNSPNPFIRSGDGCNTGTSGEVISSSFSQRFIRSMNGSCERIVSKSLRMGLSGAVSLVAWILVVVGAERACAESAMLLSCHL